MEVKAAGSNPAHGQRVFSERALLLHFASCLMFRVASPRGTGVFLEFVERVFWVLDLVFNFVSFRVLRGSMFSTCDDVFLDSLFQTSVPILALKFCKRRPPLVGGTRGDGQGVTTLAGASVCLDLCCTDRLTPCAGCDF